MGLVAVLPSESAEHLSKAPAAPLPMWLFLEIKGPFCGCPFLYRKQSRHIKTFPHKDLTDGGNLVSCPLSARRSRGDP